MIEIERTNERIVFSLEVGEAESYSKGVRLKTTWLAKYESHTIILNEREVSDLIVALTYYKGVVFNS